MTTDPTLFCPTVPTTGLVTAGTALGSFLTPLTTDWATVDKLEDPVLLSVDFKLSTKFLARSARDETLDVEEILFWAVFVAVPLALVPEDGTEALFWTVAVPEPGVVPVTPEPEAVPAGLF